MEFRTLNADEIELRVGIAKSNGFSLLLYKNSRADMQLLDETVGAMNWKREHSRDNANCIVSIWDADKKEWVGKEDTGTESQTEREKGLASDSFKRACVNWGIGRELYTAPFVWIDGHVESDSRARSGYKPDQKYVSGLRVGAIEYSDNRTITKLSIEDSSGDIVYSYGMKQTASKKKEKPSIITDEHAAEIKLLLEEKNADVPKFLEYFKVASVEKLTEEQYVKAHKMLMVKK